MQTRLTPKDRERQELYRDARFKKQYDQIWKSVGKCVFCDLNEKYIFYEENGMVMTVSLFAYIDGHFMIIPRRHVKSAHELSQLEWDTIRKFTYIAKKTQRDSYKTNGMQLVQKNGSAAQSTVNHFHFHCIPFDKPDLCQWNYRKLKYTPLENVQNYKASRKKIISYGQRYEQKYTQTNLLPVVCDLIIINKKQQVLFQERQEQFKFQPDNLSLPGGHVDDFSITLEQELAREIFEETGLKIDPARVRLLTSRISSVKYAKKSEHLNVRYALRKRFLWNVYVLERVDPKIRLRPGDDSAGLVWLPIESIETHERISDGIKAVIKRLRSNDLN